MPEPEGENASLASLRIEPVASRHDLRRFLTMPAAIYRGDPHWVPPLLFERLEHLNAKENPFLAGIDVTYWVAFRGDRPVGRISAQVNAKHLARYQDATGHFGFLEAEDDREVFAALVETAQSWLRARGMRRIAGPFNLSINDECGLLVEGFDTPPNMMMGHGRPYYGPRLEEQGFAKAKDLICYDFDMTSELPEPALRMHARLAKMPGLTFRSLDMRRYQDEIRSICDIFNDAWSDNWGFIPFGEEEALFMAKSIRPLVGPDWFAIGEVEGEPAAMAVTLPNLNEAIRDLNGRLLPFGWAKLLWRLKVRGVRTGRMPLMGVRKKYHATAKGAALALGVMVKIHAYHRAHGKQRAELSWILEDNTRMHEMIRLVGAEPYKTYRIYEKSLA